MKRIDGASFASEELRMAGTANPEVLQMSGGLWSLAYDTGFLVQVSNQ